MAEVWKFTLHQRDNTVEMPAGARLLSVGYQDIELRLWAAVDPSAPKVKRLIRVVGTGHPAPDLDGAFIGTAFHPYGLVFHAFDYGDQPGA